MNVFISFLVYLLAWLHFFCRFVLLSVCPFSVVVQFSMHFSVVSIVLLQIKRYFLVTDTPPSSVTEAVSCGSGLDDSVMSLSFSSMSTSITSLTRQSMSARYCNDTGKNSLNCNWIQGALNIYYDENVSMIKPRLAGAGLKQCFFSVNSLGGSSPLPPENIVAGNELIWTRLLFFLQ